MNQLVHYYQKDLSRTDQIGIPVLNGAMGVLGGFIGGLFGHPVLGFTIGVGFTGLISSFVMSSGYVRFKDELLDSYERSHAVNFLIDSPDFQHNNSSIQVISKKIINQPIYEYHFYYEQKERPFISVEYHEDKDDFTYQYVYKRWAELDEYAIDLLDALEERIRKNHKNGTYVRYDNHLIESKSLEDDVTKKIDSLYHEINLLKENNVFSREDLYLLNTIIPNDLSSVSSLYESFSEGHRDKNKEKIFDMIFLIEGKLQSVFLDKETEKEQKLDHLHKLFEERYNK